MVKESVTDQRLLTVSVSLASECEGRFCTLHFYTRASSDIMRVLTGEGPSGLCRVLCTLNPRCSVLVDISASFLS